MKQVLIFGDSLVDKLIFEDSFEYSYHVESYPGFLAKDMVELLTITLTETKWDYVVLCFGTNDLGHGFLPEETVNHLLQLHQLISCTLIVCYLHEQDIFNELYAEKTRHDVFFLDFFLSTNEWDETNHLTPLGKEEFVNAIQECIECDV
jgi:hypothetical protein